MTDLSRYRMCVVDPVDVPVDMRKLLLELLDHLSLELIVEATPDYTSYEIRKKEP